MTIEEIKKELDMKSLPFNWFVAEDGTKTDWLRVWNNDSRKAVLMHKDVDDMLQNNPGYDGLHLHKVEKEGEQGKFTNYTICGAARVY